MNKTVIYTCIVNNYTKLQEPALKDSEYDYVCFTDNMNIPTSLAWKIRPIPYKNSNHAKTSRFVKLNPHLVFPEYEYSIWMDSNIVIAGNFIYNKTKELIENKTLLAIPIHPKRNCIYDEAMVCIKDGRDNKKVILKQMEFLRNEGFPEGFGLYENNIIFRKHNAPAIISLDEAWWDIYIRFSKRDQLSLCYLLWKKQISCIPLLKNGVNVRNHVDFKYIYHNQKISQKLKVKLQVYLNKFN